MKKKTLIASTLLLVLTAAALYGYSEFNRTHKDLLQEQSLLAIDAASLIGSFENDATAFQQKFTGQILTVSGTVKRVDASENPVVISLGFPGSLSAVQCSMDSTHRSLYGQLKEGMAIKIKGLCSGARTDELFGTDVILNRCVPVIR